jgi:predicted metalloprotease
MKTDGRRQSENVEDRRGETAGGGGVGGFRFPAGRIPIGRGGIGGGIGLVVIILLALYFGVDPSALLDSGSVGTTSTTPGAPYQETPEEAQRNAFVRVVLADTEDTWTGIFQGAGRQYDIPTLVLYRDGVDSACGFAQSAVGPFYCPSDQKVYLDLAFFDDMSGKLGAGGDFAFAYVVAHEIGHHVQTLVGTTARVNAARERASEDEANALSVRMELQADCYAGVWANRTEQQKHVLEAGDIDEAMNAAAAVGDDRLQKRARGYVVPESFTHGTSAQRAKWFRLGLQTGDMDRCDTFSASDL